MVSKPEGSGRHVDGEGRYPPANAVSDLPPSEWSDDDIRTRLQGSGRVPGGVIGTLREAEVLIAEGATVPEAAGTCGVRGHRSERADLPPMAARARGTEGRSGAAARARRQAARAGGERSDFGPGDLHGGGRGNDRAPRAVGWQANRAHPSRDHAPHDPAGQRSSRSTARGGYTRDEARGLIGAWRRHSALGSRPLASGTIEPPIARAPWMHPPSARSASRDPWRRRALFPNIPMGPHEGAARPTRPAIRGQRTFGAATSQV